MIILMQENKFLKFLSFMWNPLSWVMEAAAVMAIVLANGGVSKIIFCMNFYFYAMSSAMASIGYWKSYPDFISVFLTE